jgi:uncharacterized protein
LTLKQRGGASESVTSTDAAPRVVIAGVSTRALAVSAVRAGYQVTAVDAFADLDLRSVADIIPLRPELGTAYSPHAAVAATRGVAADMIVYTSNFENYPAAVARLGNGRQLLGNKSGVLIRVRHPVGLSRSLRRAGFVVPETRASAPADDSTDRRWLLKPRRSGGGHGTTGWRRGERIPRTHYLQERIIGTPASVLFAADGRRAVPLGISRQLVGDRRFGAGGLRYCGSLLGPPTALFPRQQARELIDTTTQMASFVTAEFGLVGLNGIDFIARNGVPYPIEVNPRYSASMELLERAHGLSVFRLHVQACHGRLPQAPVHQTEIQGKAIVFARRAVTMGDTRRWLEHDSFADVPHPGERIRRGHPICTVLAAGNSAAACLDLLVRRAEEVYRIAGCRKGRAA